MFNKVIIVLLLCFKCFWTIAQCPENDNKKAQKLYEKGTDKKRYENIRDRQIYLREAIEENPDFAAAYYELGNTVITLYKANGDPLSNAKTYYAKAVELCPTVAPYPYFYLGQIAFGTKEYADAKKYFKQFIDFESDKKKNEDLELAQTMYAKSNFLAYIFANPVEFNPYPISSIDTYEDEYLANLTPDNEIIFYTHRYQKKGRDELVPRMVEELTQANKNETDYINPKALEAPFNFNGDGYGGATFSIDNEHMFITVCKPEKKTGQINCDIYTADLMKNGLVKDKWSPLRNLGPNVNTVDGWESQPSLSADGKTLYFASMRADSRGMDIYFSKKNDEGEWGPAENLGSPINTEKDEKSPFIHSDSHTLYFCSNGHLGLGGYDIFYSKADEKGKLQKPKNIGVPINTDKDEVGLIVSTNGEKAFFSSNELKGKGAGAWDVFTFNLHKEARPDKIVFLKGTLTNEDGTKPAASIEIKGSLSQSVQKVNVDTVSGKYTAVYTLKNDEDILVTVKQQGKAFTSQLIKQTAENVGKPIKQDFQQKEIEIGKSYNINNIQYKTNSSDLADESKFVIQEFANYLKENDNLKVEIRGHTDNVGNSKSNLALSTDRAFTVLVLLQQLGINKDKLSFKGFGDTSPIADNNTELGKAKNRRTEFMILTK